MTASKTPHNRRAICILGMHRSGTSTVTRAVNLLGAYLGEEKDIMAPAADNPEGFWERDDIVKIHERLLDAVKRKWDTVAPLPDKWYLDEELRPFREMLTELIGSNFSLQPLWAWKDPRTCILIDLWQHLLDGFGIELSYLFVVRNPLDVASSLKKRNGFEVDRSLGIWFNYNITALHHLSGARTVFISYDRFLDDCENQLRKCAIRLDVQWPENDSQLKELLHSFLRTDLRHSVSDVSALRAAPVPVQSLYTLLTEAVESPLPVAPAFFEKVEQLYGDFFSHARFFQTDLAALWDRNRQVVEMQRRQEHPPRPLDEADKLRRLLAERDLQIAQCHQRLTERDLRITGLYNSFSWRITAPLRTLAWCITRRRGE